ncbi:TRAP transporter small permease [Ruegeria sp. HKCCD8929]|uniref:TRAP transporter small permease n=1 Tax=Ruegeria sp. HKCCD8929 TaxID=2683006 RepID=UPI001488FF04|nr:TRAP transporter small permease subunit [Ruegeria sp. HKCCD8929]
MELADQIPARLQRPVRIMLAAKVVFVSVSCMIMAFTFFFVVIFRYILETDLFAYEEWLMVICFWLFFMAGALGTYDESHINADLLSEVLRNPRVLRVRALIVTLVEFIVLLFAVYWAALMIIDEIQSYPYWQQTIALRIPFLVPRLSILVGFMFMGFFTGLRLYVLAFTQPGAIQPDANE